MAEATNGTAIRARRRCTALGTVVMCTCRDCRSWLMSGYLESSELKMKKSFIMAQAADDKSQTDKRLQYRSDWYVSSCRR